MTEPDLSRCALIPSNLSRRSHTRRSANDYEVRSRESLSLKNAYMRNVNMQVRKCRHLPLIVDRLGSGCQLFR